jgi:hypothetical protein
MLIGAAFGGLEVRAEGDGGARLSGRFPYGVTATLDSGGNGRRPRKERIAPRAFRYAVEDPDREIHLLAGHSFDRPLASKRGGSLKLRDGDDALAFEARIAPEVAQTSHGRDVLALVASGLAVGLSPGFRVAPREVVEKPEEVVEEDPREGNALIRVVRAAILFELSVVTRPAYDEATVEARDWTPSDREATVERQLRRMRAMRQWRV